MPVIRMPHGLLHGSAWPKPAKARFGGEDVVSTEVQLCIIGPMKSSRRRRYYTRGSVTRRRGHDLCCQPGMAQQMIADSEIDIAAARGLILQAYWELDQGRSAAQSTAIARTFCAEAIWRIVDRSLQICDSLGVSADILLGRFLREVRPFRIYDGPSETHRWAIARRSVRRHDEAAAG